MTKKAPGKWDPFRSVPCDRVKSAELLPRRSGFKLTLSDNDTVLLQPCYESQFDDCLRDICMLCQVPLPT